ncbi:SURF1 family protein [Roseibium aestuarii]|uniref:SURF1-like protein n=1 Tax=Roseibium aestuarii TaxID=2600299 RepID=A0ABW4JVM0_9HYPH|nr:SURF1 family protein [Roseibium aestuarii]
MTDWRQRRRANLVLLGIACVAVICLVLLGNWQLRRLAWKTTLIAQVETRAHGAPVPAPARADWPSVSADTHAYLRVAASGRYLPGHDTPVKAVTDLGPGYWILSPLETNAGEIVWINRGFVPTELRDPDAHAPVPAGPVTVTGLLRIGEPEGTLLQANEPEKGRWYSRDVDALSASAGLPSPAPYFIDAEQGADPAAYPRGGLTIISFRNNHLQYALTWYAMALGLAAAIVFMVRLARRPARSSELDDD